MSQRPARRKTFIEQARITAAIGNRYNPIRVLTPETLGQQIDRYKTGRLRSLAMVMDAVEERDSTVKTVVAKRKKSVARLPWEVLTVRTDQEAKARAHAETLERFYNQVVATDVLRQDQRGGLSLLIRQMMDAQGKGYAVHEVSWEPRTDGGTLAATFRFCPLWWFESITGRLRYLETEAAYNGVELEPGGWLVSCGDALMVPTVIAYVFKLFPLRDWLSFCEKFGLPGVLGSTAASPGTPEWTAMETAVAAVMNDWAAVKGLEDRIELLKADGGSNLPFAPLVEYMDRKIAALWRGADLSTISQGKEGVGASLQGDETDLLLEDDAAWVEETLAEQVSHRVIEYAHGDSEPLAYLKLSVPKRRQIDADDKAIRLCLDSGIPLGVDATRERLGLPAPDEGEDVLQRAPMGDLSNLPQDASGDRRGTTSLANAQSPELMAIKGQGLDSGRTTPELDDGFLAAARRQFGQAVAADLAPLRRRLEAIEKISDPEIRRARLEALLADWDSLAGDITADPEAAGAMARIQGAALADGLAAVRNTPITNL